MSRQMTLGRKLVGLGFALLLAGCVTETSGGGLPEPAPKSERIDAHLNLARGYLADRHWARARVALNRALEIDASNVETHVLLAVLNENENEKELAEDHYRLALRHGPNDPQALNNYGVFLLRDGRFEEALKPLRKLVRNPNYHLRAEAYENLGIAEQAAQNAEAAREAFAKALSLNPQLPRSNLELAMFAFHEQAYSIAANHYELFRRSARQTPRSLCFGIQLALALQDRDQAASYQMALKNLYPRSQEARACEVPQ